MKWCVHFFKCALFSEATVTLNYVDSVIFVHDVCIFCYFVSNVALPNLPEAPR